MLKLVEKAAGNDTVGWDDIGKDVLSAFVFEKMGAALSKRTSEKLLKVLENARKGAPPDLLQRVHDNLLRSMGTWIQVAVVRASEEIYDVYVSRKPPIKWRDLGDEIIEAAMKKTFEEHTADILKELGEA